MGARQTREVHEVPEDEIKWLGHRITHVFCNACFMYKKNRKTVACFICHDCEKYLCEECAKCHDISHNLVNKYVNGEEEALEKESTIDSFLTEMMNESKEERKERYMKEDVGVCDEVNTWHGLDSYDTSDITGLCGYQSYKSKRWVACDYDNKFIKIYSLGANVLQRYIKFDLKPFDVTEITFEQQHRDLHSASTSSSSRSGRPIKPTNKHVLAVTCPLERQILVLDLNKRPAIKDRIIKMKKHCWGIEFNEDKLFTVCTETANYRWFVCIVSLDGDKLNEFRTDIRCHNPLFYICAPSPYITVLNGNIYMTDPENNKIKCFNVDGKVMAELTTEGLMPVGIGVDRSSNKLYVSAWEHNKVYEVDSGLSGYKSILERTTGFLNSPSVLSFYGDKLYISNEVVSPHVTVVQLL